MHLQPIFENSKFFSHLDFGSYSEYLFNEGMCLPSDTKMSKSDQDIVILSLIHI